MMLLNAIEYLQKLKNCFIKKRIVTEWLPTSGYEYGNAPDIEVYLNSDADNTKYEVWIPVLKKES